MIESIQYNTNTDTLCRC